jgi:hypothetical protein
MKKAHFSPNGPAIVGFDRVAVIYNLLHQAKP